jgi:hypothetical protein
VLHKVAVAPMAVSPFLWYTSQRKKVLA